jgi:hypothetical protein
LKILQTILISIAGGFISAIAYWVGKGLWIIAFTEPIATNFFITGVAVTFMICIWLEIH